MGKDCRFDLSKEVDWGGKSRSGNRCYQLDQTAKFIGMAKKNM